MSRSYKKTPICKGRHSGVFGKKRANKKVRYYKGEIGNGKVYRKLYNSWNIQDFVIYYSPAMRKKDQEAEEKASVNLNLPNHR